MVASCLVIAGLLSTGTGIAGAAPPAAAADNGSDAQSATVRQTGPQPGVNGLTSRPMPSPRQRASTGGGDNPARIVTPARSTLPMVQVALPTGRMPSVFPAGPQAAPVTDGAPEVADVPAAAASTAPVAVPPRPAVSSRVPTAGAAVVPAAEPLRQPLALMPRPLRLGLPLAVGEAALPQLDPLAMPGLVALVGLMLIGAYMGYRQARVGLFPNSTRSRFLQ